MGKRLKPIETEYAGRRFRSRLEARWGVFFDALGWPYDYEREGFDFDGEYYLPDFYLAGFPMWLEVKPVAPTAHERLLCSELHKRSGRMVLIAIGPPSPIADICVFDWENQINGKKFRLRADRRNKGQYWLEHSEVYAPTYAALPLDQGIDLPHDRYPIISGELRRAFAKAASARFEYGAAAA